MLLKLPNTSGVTLQIKKRTQGLHISMLNQLKTNCQTRNYQILKGTTT